MTTSEERIAKGVEALARIAQEIKDEWRADREAITVHETMPTSQERLIPLPDKSYIVVGETFTTPIFGYERFNGTLYDRNGGEPVEICGQIAPRSIIKDVY